MLLALEIWLYKLKWSSTGLSVWLFTTRSVSTSYAKKVRNISSWQQNLISSKFDLSITFKRLKHKCSENVDNYVHKYYAAWHKKKRRLLQCNEHCYIKTTFKFIAVFSFNLIFISLCLLSYCCYDINIWFWHNIGIIRMAKSKPI